VSVRWPFRVRKSDYCGIGMGSGVIAHQLTRYVSAWHMQTWVCIQELHAGAIVPMACPLSGLHRFDPLSWFHQAMPCAV
jgi:hypothetical protein